MKQHKVCMPLFLTVVLFALSVYCAIPATARTTMTRVTSGVVPVSEESPVSAVQEEQPVEPVKPVNGITPVSPITPIEPIKPISEVSPFTPIKPIQPIEPVEPVSELQPITPIKPITPNSEVTQSDSNNSEVNPNEENSASGPVTVLSSQLHELPAGGVSSQSAASVKPDDSSMSTPLTVLLTVIIFFVGFTGALFAVNPKLRHMLTHKKLPFVPTKKKDDNDHT